MADDEDRADETKQIAIRLPVPLLERVHRHAGRLRRRNRGLTITRAEAIRALLIEALDRADERETPAKTTET